MKKKKKKKYLCGSMRQATEYSINIRKICIAGRNQNRQILQIKTDSIQASLAKEKADSILFQNIFPLLVRLNGQL
jgi:ribosomal protein S8E